MVVEAVVLAEVLLARVALLVEADELLDCEADWMASAMAVASWSIKLVAVEGVALEEVPLATVALPVEADELLDCETSWERYW